MNEQITIYTKTASPKSNQKLKKFLFILLALAAVLFAGIFLFAAITDGSLSPDFGGINTYNGGYGDSIVSMVKDASGRIVAAGYINDGTANRAAVWRFAVNGTLDRTFGVGGRATLTNVANPTQLNDVTINLASGKIYATGTLDSTNKMVVVFAVNSDGTKDTSFAGSGYAVANVGPGFDCTGRAIAVAPSGEIKIVCDVAENVMIIQGFNQSGADLGYFVKDNIAGGGGQDIGYDIIINSSGIMYITGSSTGPSTTLDMFVYAMNTAGTPYAVFNGTGIAVQSGTAGGTGDDTGYGISLDASGRVLVAGSSANSSGNQDMVLWRFTAAGALDTAFNSTGYVIRDNIAGGNWNDMGYSVCVDGSGSILVSGTTWNAGANYDACVLRYTSSGSLDTTFNTTGIYVNYGAAGGYIDDSANSVIVDNSGNIVLGGISHNGTDDDSVIWRLKNDGTLPGYNLYTGPAGSDLNQIANCVIRDASGNLYFGGQVWNTTNGWDHIIWKARPNGSIIWTYSVSWPGTGAIRGIAFDQTGKIVGVGESNSDMLIVRLNTDGTYDTTFNTSGFATHAGSGMGSDAGYAVTYTNTGKIAVTGSSYNGTDDNMAVWVYNTSNGALDTGFNGTGFFVHHNAAGGNGNDRGFGISRLSSNSNLLITGESYGPLNYQMAVWKLSSTGVLDSYYTNEGISSKGNGSGKAISQVSTTNRIIIAGRSMNSSSIYDVTLWAVDQATMSLDTAFGASGLASYNNAAENLNDGANAIALDPWNNILVAGYTGTAANGDDMLLVKFNAGGGLDTSFDSDGAATHHNAAGGAGTDEARGIALDAVTNRIYTAGLSSSVSGNFDAVVWKHVEYVYVPTYTPTSPPTYTSTFTQTSTATMVYTPCLSTSWGGFGGSGGQFYTPYNVCMDSNQYLYVSDRDNDRVQKFDANGNFITLWSVTKPTGITVGNNGNIYVATNTDQIYVFGSSGNNIRSWGGTGSSNGQFRSPAGLDSDSAGNIYVADSQNNRVQKFDADGNYITSWGVTNGPVGIAVGNNNDVYVSKSLSGFVYHYTTEGVYINIISNGTPGVYDVDVDAAGDVYIVDTNNNEIRVYNAAGTIIKSWGYGQLSSPLGICVSGPLEIYVVDTGYNRIRKYGACVFPSNTITPTYTSTPSITPTFSATVDINPPCFISKWGSSGSGDGFFQIPYGIAKDTNGDIFVCDSNNNRIQKFTAEGVFITKWGSFGSGDGQFSYPTGVAVDSLGNIYVSEEGNRIQKFTSNGVFISKWGMSGTGDGQFQYPQGLCIDSSDNVYVTDWANNRVQKFTSSGTFLGKWGVSGSGNGQFSYPAGITTDNSGNIYVMDFGNNRVQKFTSAGVFILKWGSLGNSDGQFNQALGIDIDNYDNVFVADSFNARMQKFNSSGSFITKWGGVQGGADWQFNNPRGVLADNNGNIYIADGNNYRVVRYGGSCPYTPTATPTNTIVPAGVYTLISSVGANNRINAIVSDDNYAYIGGDFTDVGGFVRNRIAKINTSTGQVDTVFNPGADGSVYSLYLDGSGNLYVGGGFTNIGGQARTRLAKLDAVTGAVDGTFNPGANGNVRALELDGSGNLYVGGEFTVLGVYTRNRIGKVNSGTGTVDTSFNPNANNWVYDMELDGNGNLFVGGEFITIGGQSRNRIAKLECVNGTADATFNPGESDWIHSVQLDGTGYIYSGGNVQTRRFNAVSGINDPGFNAGFSFAVRHLRLDTLGYLYVAGSFTTMGGQARNRVARINASTGTADLDFDPNANGQVFAMSLSPAKAVLHLGGDFTTIMGTTANRYAAISLANFPTPPSTPTMSFTITPTFTLSSTLTSTLTPTTTWTLSSTNTDTPTETWTLSYTLTPTSTWTLTGTNTASPTMTSTATITPTMDLDPLCYVSQFGTAGTGDGQLNAPYGVKADNSGYVYVADTSNHRIQKFTSAGMFVTKWGEWGTGDSQFRYPGHIALDSSGNVYVADIYNCRIQKFTSDGVYLSQWGSYGTGDGQFDLAYGICIDNSDNVYVVDYRNNRIQKFTTAGVYVSQWGSPGTGDGQFADPRGIASDAAGNVYVPDMTNNRIQKFTSTGSFVTKWGVFGTGDGQFSEPQGIDVDGSGAVYVTDYHNHRIQKFNGSGVFIAKWGSYGSAPGELMYPGQISADNSGYVYVANGNNNRIEKFGVCPPTPTFTPTSTWTLSSTLTPTSTWTLSSTNTDTPTLTWTLSSTLTPTNTWTLSSTSTDTPTLTWTLSSTLTPTNTWTLSSTSTDTPTLTWTLSSTLTPTNTWTLSSTNTDTPTLTWTMSSTLTPTNTWTLSSTNTDTPTLTWTLSSTLTPTNTWTLSSTSTDTPTLTWTLSSTLTPTLSSTPTFTQTAGTGCGSPQIFGNNSGPHGEYWQTSAYIWTHQDILTQGGTITDIMVDVHTAGNMMAGLYDNANNLIVSSSIVSVTGTGWQSVDIPDTHLNAGTYKIVIQTDNVGAVWSEASGSMNAYANTYGTLPALLSGIWVLNGRNMLLYANYCPDTETATFTPTHTLTSTSIDTPTETWTLSSTLTPTLTLTLSSTLTPTLTWTLTSTNSDTPTETWTLSSTLTPTLTSTLSSTLTSTLTWTLTSTETETPTETWTLSSTLTPTSTWTLQFTDTYTFTSTNTPASSFTFTTTLTPTETNTPATGVSISGTLTLPQAKAGNMWAVILMHGNGIMEDFAFGTCGAGTTVPYSINSSYSGNVFVLALVDSDGDGDLLDAGSYIGVYGAAFPAYPASENVNGTLTQSNIDITLYAAAANVSGTITMPGPYTGNIDIGFGRDGDNITTTSYCNGSSFTYSFIAFWPGDYMIRSGLDHNWNSSWDAGDYLGYYNSGLPVPIMTPPAVANALIPDLLQTYVFDFTLGEIGATPTPTGTLTAVLSPTMTMTGTAIPAATSSYTATITLTVTLTSTNVDTPTETWTLLSTLTPTLTWTLTATNTDTPTETWTLSSTLTPTSTWTLTPTLTSTLTNTNTPVDTVSPVSTSTSSPTLTRTVTPVNTVANTSTCTATLTAVWTNTATPLNTPVLTATITPTIGAAVVDTGTSICYPQPASDSITIRFTAESAGNAKIFVYSLSGMQVALFETGNYGAGVTEKTFDVRKFAPGIYFYVIDTGGQRFKVKKFVVER